MTCAGFLMRWHALVALFWAFLGACIAPVTAYAATPIHKSPHKPLTYQQLKKCTAIKVDTYRLRCFDALVGQQQFIPSGSDKKAKAVAENTTGSLAAEQVVQPKESMGFLDKLYSLRVTDEDEWFKIVPHRDIYVLPIWYSSNPQYRISTPTQQVVGLNTNQLQGVEAAFKLSFKTKLLSLKGAENADLRLWLGYTQLAHWQLYNGAQSRPFRNTDYEPELFATVPLQVSLPLNGSLRVAGVGLVHQSNGRSDPYSRSWNRVYAFAAAQWGNFYVQPRLWYRLEPSNSKDDNPDITHYLGHGDMRVAYQLNDKSMLKGVLRYNVQSNKGAVQLGYSYKLQGGLRLYVHAHSGYGANLLEYNHKNNAIGVGLMLNEWIGF